MGAWKMTFVSLKGTIFIHFPLLYDYRSKLAKLRFFFPPCNLTFLSPENFTPGSLEIPIGNHPFLGVYVSFRGLRIISGWLRPPHFLRLHISNYISLMMVPGAPKRSKGQTADGWIPSTPVRLKWTAREPEHWRPCVSKRNIMCGNLDGMGFPQFVFRWTSYFLWNLNHVFA